MSNHPMHKVEIKVVGQIDKQWSEWLGGLDIDHSQPNETVLSGYLHDQAALYGIISRLRDLGLQLKSIHDEEINEPFKLRKEQKMKEKTSTAGKISLGTLIQKLSVTKPILVCVILFIIATFFRWIDSFVLRLDERIGELILTKSLGLVLVLAFIWVTRHKIKDIGLHSKFLLQNLLIGTVTSLVAFCFGYGVEVLLAYQKGTQPTFQFGAIDPKMGVSGGILFALFLLVGNFINSFMEDGLFRGVMSRLAKIRFGFWKANLFQAFMFGIWHLPWVLRYLLRGEITSGGELFVQIVFNSVPQLLVGIVYGYMYLKTSSLWAPWLAHTISNSASNFLHVTTTEGMDPGLPVRMSVYLVVMLFGLFWVKYVTKKHEMPEIEPWK